LQSRFGENDLYYPSEDTFFLADHIENETGDKALDIGTGSGYLAKILYKKFNLVLATDINFKSLLLLNSQISNLFCCNGADALRGKFDLVVCNLPYLPSDKIIDRTTDGGKEGMEIPIKIIKSAVQVLAGHGRLLFLTSSLANYEKLLEKTQSLGFKVKVLSRKKLFFEELILVEVKK